MMLRWLILLSLFASLLACGFQLRGFSTLPEHLSELQLQAEGLSTNQKRSLSQQLRRAGASLSDDTDRKAMRLRVSIESLAERKLVDSAGAGQSIVRLTRQLTYSLIDDSGNRLVDNKTISQKLDLEFEDSNLLSLESEKQNALQSLDAALINSLLIQLSRL